VDRVVVDAAEEPLVAEACAVHALSRWTAPELLADARAGGSAKWRRIAALLILTEARHPGVLPLLREALGDPDRDVVDAALKALGRLRERAAARLLIDVLCEYAYPPSRVASILDRFPLPIPDLICPLTRSPRPVVRFWAATLLARYHSGPEIEAALATLVSDEDPRVRKAAAVTLGRLGSPQAMNVALRLLDDPVFYVRAHAVRALAALGRPALAELIAPALGDRNWWVRLAAKESLMAMGSIAGPALLPYLDSPDRFARNAAAEVLQNLGLVREWIRSVATNGSDPEKLGLLRKVAAAGGVRMIDAALDGLPQLGPRVVSLLGAAGPITAERA
jgi:HEAT repeat protein